MKKKSLSKQSQLIGEHPDDKSKYITEWLISEDKKVTKHKTHRALTENSKKRNSIIGVLSKELIKYHIPKSKLERIENKKKILSKYGFNKYIKSIDTLPKTEITQRANFGEILLTEYLIHSTGLQLLVFKLHFNPNIEQSMKGDDILLFKKSSPIKKMIVGESKFRSKPNKKVITDLINSFDENHKLPISISFVAERLYDAGDNKLAELIENLLLDLPKRKTDIVQVGFLISDTNTQLNVEKHLKSKNEKFIMLSLGVSEPTKLVKLTFDKAIKILESYK